MKRKESYVFDTNVIISALLISESKPGQAFFAALDRGQILLSAPVFLELSNVLSREKFASYILQEERERFLAVLLRIAVLVEIHESIRVCRDPKDDIFLELAINGKATCIITGDGDLLRPNFNLLDYFHEWYKLLGAGHPTASVSGTREVKRESIARNVGRLSKTPKVR